MGRTHQGGDQGRGGQGPAHGHRPGYRPRAPTHTPAAGEHATGHSATPKASKQSRGDVRMHVTHSARRPLPPPTPTFQLKVQRFALTKY
jgi:hypothetical protein